MPAPEAGRPGSDTRLSSPRASFRSSAAAPDWWSSGGSGSQPGPLPRPGCGRVSQAATKGVLPECVLALLRLMFVLIALLALLAIVFLVVAGGGA
jgi:hypothetical protein